jgi:RHS repeat-associated protein
VKVWTATYTPFGGVHTSTGALPTARFPGQWFQSESGLHQNWMRDYDPTTGRYLQADPLGLVDGASVYGYVTQNPGRWIDPRGEFVWVIPVAVVTAGLIYTFILCDYYMDHPLILTGPFWPEWFNSEADGDEPAGEGGSSSPPWAGIRDVAPHPDGPVQGGSKEQGIKEGGAEQAEKDFEEATGGEWQPIGDGKLRGTGPNGENIVYNPSSTGGPSKTDGGFPTIYVDGNKIRYR